MGGKCESCVYYSYDEEYDDYICEIDLDEDEMVRFLTARADSCPYWRPETSTSPPEAIKTIRHRQRPVPYCFYCGLIGFSMSTTPSLAR